MEGTVFEIFLEEKKLVKIEISREAEGLDIIACFEALRQSFDASSWASICAFESIQAEEPATGRIFKIVCLEKAK